MALVRLDDRALPAARYLVTDDARDVLRVPIEGSDGELESCRVVDVSYRPGADVVVRYSAQVSWNGAPSRRETLVAATTAASTYPGAARVVAETPSGPLEVDVWRWPFDPVLVGLGEVVTPSSAARLIGHADHPDPISLDVVAYRPTERAVVRVNRAGVPVAYIKLVPPAHTDGIALRHDRLRQAGVPAARVVRHDVERGIVVMDALHGPTLRELVKSGAPRWPDAGEFDRLADRLASTNVQSPGPASRITDGSLHALTLAGVLPSMRDRLMRLADRFDLAGAAPVDGTVHGDLYDAQVIVDDGRIVGLLDVDDVGPGASIDDRANLIARLVYRAVNRSDPARIVDAGVRARVADYASELRDTSAARHDLRRLDLHVAACLVGLATGPFRLQSEGWRDAVADLVTAAEELSTSAPRQAMPKRH